MPYTGINDKHNREIYKSDIVKIDGILDEDIITQVRWSIGSFTANKGNLHRTLVHWAQESIEVIGNIYKNTELINEITK